VSETALKTPVEVGARVRILRPARSRKQFTNACIYWGSEGRVIRRDSLNLSNQPVWIITIDRAANPEDAGRTVTIRDAELEVIEPRPLAMGDRIRVTGIKDHNGRLGTVFAIDESDLCPIDVELDTLPGTLASVRLSLKRDEVERV